MAEQAPDHVESASCLGAKEAFDALNLARSNFGTLSTLYITGVGLTFAIWAAVSDVQFRQGLMIFALPFLFFNYWGFLSNLTFQMRNFSFLDAQVHPADPARAIVDAMQPIGRAKMTLTYLLVTAFVLAFGWYFADGGLEGLRDQIQLGEQDIDAGSPTA
ncbi:hypothetical protein [Paraurantiacibacter namhicola]|uniref:Uncharacterized protein n=1 Tax=Paraurantiacibacter namhicola TaxID=645517 RepID=A0A1C7D6A6_9SPHN|nr:hypothetical protein [Paraurantiacibacter namhicola]ANU06999.1 hypothetical protein A6F65_00677 [Paraurantiacibacter namhicola]